MEYKIVSSNCSGLFEKSVNEYIRDGYLPFGNMVIDSNNYIMQAMTRTCKPKNTKKVSGLQPSKVIDLWNDLARAIGLPSKRKVTATLENTIRIRINEKDGFPTIGDWQSYFKAISRAKFLTGNNDRGWKADLDWAIKPKSIASVIEGKYHNG